ncbi:hypothetical protein FB45DRAFT_1131588, partial [Roridomyces roridus]
GTSKYIVPRSRRLSPSRAGAGRGVRPRPRLEDSEKPEPAQAKPKPAASSQAGAGKTLMLIEHISRFLGVADVCTARGLKQCHDAFDTVSSKLDALYAQTREFRSDCASADRLSSISADRLAAAIILTYSRIAVDAKLGSRIFAETQFFPKAMALFSSPDLSVGGTVMKALQNITAQLDIAIVKEMLPFLPTILDYCETNRAGLKDGWMDDGVYVLTRCAAGVFLDDNPDPELMAQVPLPHIPSLFAKRHPPS